MSAADSSIYLLSDIAYFPHVPSPLNTARSASPVICPSPRLRRKLASMGRSLLASVTDYLYDQAQDARDAVERDAYSLALGICGAARRGSLHTYKEACLTTFGCVLEKHITRRNGWRDLIYAEFRAVSSAAAQTALAQASVRTSSLGSPSISESVTESTREETTHKPSVDIRDSAERT